MSAQSAVMEVTDATFAEVITQFEVLVLEVWAPWCQPCHRFAPIYEATAQQCGDEEIQFAKMNVDENQQVPAILGVQSVPTLLGFRQGILVFRKAGLLSQRQLGEVVGRIQAVDPQQVRAQLANARRAEAGEIR